MKNVLNNVINLDVAIAYDIANNPKAKTKWVVFIETILDDKNVNSIVSLINDNKLSNEPAIDIINNEITRLLAINSTKYQEIKDNLIIQKIATVIAIKLIDSGNPTAFKTIVKSKANSKNKYYTLDNWHDYINNKDPLLVPQHCDTLTPTQCDILNDFDKKKYSILAIHRQFGKDFITWAWICRQAFRHSGNYYYCGVNIPSIKEIIWEKRIDEYGTQLTDMLPKECCVKNNQEMSFTLNNNNSIIKLMGLHETTSTSTKSQLGRSGHYVLSEAAQLSPQMWGKIEPIIRNNKKSTCRMISTFEGANWYYDLFVQHSKDEPTSDFNSWYTKILPATHNPDFNKNELENAKRDCLTIFGNDLLYRQEYLCEVVRAKPNAVYAHILSDLYNKGNLITNLYNPMFPIKLVCDLGVDDKTSIIAYQKIDGKINIIDAVERSGYTLERNIDDLKGKVYWRNICLLSLPFDGGNRNIALGDRSGFAIPLYKHLQGKWHFKVQALDRPKTDIQKFNPITNKPYGAKELMIARVKDYLPETFIDNDCRIVINALENYMYDKMGKPIHDGYSHTADALSYLYQENEATKTRRFSSVFQR